MGRTGIVNLTVGVINALEIIEIEHQDTETQVVEARPVGVHQPQRPSGDPVRAGAATSAPPRPRTGPGCTYRDRDDAIAEIRVLVAHAEEAGRAVRIVCIVRSACPSSVSPKRRESSGKANPDTGHHAAQADTHVGR